MSAMKTTVSCVFCDAEYTIIHDLQSPYKMAYCPFCGECVKDDGLSLDEDEDFDDMADW